MTSYSVYKSGGPHYPSLLEGAARERAEAFAIRESAADPDGMTWVIENEDTSRIAAEYREGRLRLNRPHDRRALRLARQDGAA